MTKISLTVHRSTHSIGGNCIEIATSSGHRLLLDVGRPLDAPREAKGLLPETLNLQLPVDGILVSHQHQDHCGLLDEVPDEWPVYCGKATFELLKISASISRKTYANPFHRWGRDEVLKIGPFTVTPYLTDHSAFDAYMLQIDVKGKRIFYSGDFRLHGRKGKLVEHLMSCPPKDIDVLLLEGTNIGSTKPCMSEFRLERDYLRLFQQTPGRVFVGWSAFNADRTVTLFRACKRSGRTLVVDLFTAEVMEAMAAFAKLPAPDWEQVKVVVTHKMADMYRHTGREAFVDRMAKNGIAARHLNDTKQKWVAMVRPSLMGDYQYKGVTPDASDAWCWAKWMGYLEEEDGKRVQDWFETHGTPATHIHTSGHASQMDLQAFAKCLDPKVLVPIHGINWDGAEGFEHIRRLGDGEVMCISQLHFLRA